MRYGTPNGETPHRRELGAIDRACAQLCLAPTQWTGTWTAQWSLPPCLPPCAQVPLQSLPLAQFTSVELLHNRFQ